MNFRKLENNISHSSSRLSFHFVAWEVKIYLTFPEMKELGF
jgi:hypothetical protein